MTYHKLKSLIQDYEIESTILLHPAWYGNITGLGSEHLLKGKAAYFYLLRQGEQISHYYLSFVDELLLIRHQPFAILYEDGGWRCRQGSVYGPFITQTISDLIHRIMHCKPDDCKPVIRVQ